MLIPQFQSFGLLPPHPVHGKHASSLSYHPFSRLPSRVIPLSHTVRPAPSSDTGANRPDQSREKFFSLFPQFPRCLHTVPRGDISELSSLVGKIFSTLGRSNIWTPFGQPPYFPHRALRFFFPLLAFFHPIMEDRFRVFNPSKDWPQYVPCLYSLTFWPSSLLHPAPGELHKRKDGKLSTPQNAHPKTAGPFPAEFLVGVPSFAEFHEAQS